MDSDPLPFDPDCAELHAPVTRAPQPLRHHVVLVTGGARRVGKAIAIEMAQRGARVAVHANTSIEKARELAAMLQNCLGVDADAFQADLALEGAAQDLVDRVARHFADGGFQGTSQAERIDALINSAAIWPKQPLEEMTAADLHRCYEVNTVAPMLLAKAAGLHMCSQPAGGVIVNVGDAATAPDGAPYPGYAAYHPSKAAVVGATRALAVEFAQRNRLVRVNAVLPGPVVCEHLPGEPREPGERKKHVRDASLSHTTEEGHYGRAEHVAHAVAMLVENPFINGVALPVDGGGRLA